MNRRSFLKLASASGAVTGLGGLDFGLPPVSAAEATLDGKMVRFSDEIEPIVRFIEETPRERLLEEAGRKVRAGLSYRELLSGLFLAGVRNIQPRPVGFKFHAVLVVNSAHLASLDSDDSDRWLPVFWALDQFKSSQAADVREGDWTLAPVDEKSVPPSHKARKAFIEAMDNWDEAAADAAIVGLARTAGADEIYEVLAHYGARDFREIGHKEIYVANSFRTLEAIGWQHAEPVLRSLAYALLDRDGARENPAKADFRADRPYRANLERIGQIRQGWLDGKANADASRDLLDLLRTGTPDQATDKTVELLNRGVSPRTLFDTFFVASGELMMRAPGILALHATTFTNALHYSWQHCRDEQTRKLLLLQNAAFLPLFRGGTRKEGVKIDQLETAEPGKEDSLEEIFAMMRTDHLEASRQLLGWLRKGGDTREFSRLARRMIFQKGTNTHDYKYSSAVLEDYRHIQAGHREPFLAAAAFYLKGPEHPDNEIVARARAALAT